MQGMTKTRRGTSTPFCRALARLRKATRPRTSAVACARASATRIAMFVPGQGKVCSAFPAAPMPSTCGSTVNAPTPARRSTPKTSASSELRKTISTSRSASGRRRGWARLPCSRRCSASARRGRRCTGMPGPARTWRSWWRSPARRRRRSSAASWPSAAAQARGRRASRSPSGSSSSPAFRLPEPAVPSFALRNPHTIIVGALVAALLGVTAFTRMPVDVFPNLKIPAVVVATFYPGMPPTEVERDITTRFERFFTLGSDIEHVESRSLPGVSIIKVYFHASADVDTAAASLANLAMADLRHLPPGTLPVTLVTVAGQGYSETALRDQAQYNVRNQLATVAGASVPPPFGGKYRQIMVYSDREAL